MWIWIGGCSRDMERDRGCGLGYGSAAGIWKGIDIGDVDMDRGVQQGYGKG